MLNLKRHLHNICERLDIDEIKQANYFPRYLEIEAFDGCNFDCIMCPLGKSIYKGGAVFRCNFLIKLFQKFQSIKIG